MSLRLLYYSPSFSGGLADYARAQANALSKTGITVDVLSPEKFTAISSDEFTRKPLLVSRARGASRWSSRVATARDILENYSRLNRMIKEGHYRHVLFGAYSEYLAPIWAARLRHHAQNGVIFGTIVHDPVRDYAIGPQWWHYRSIAQAYSFQREAFVHEAITIDTVRPMPHLRTTVIPHGPITFPPPSLTREQSRAKIGLPAEARVWLSFGHIRDGKNLHLAIEALTYHPDACLLVAGKEQSTGQKPVAFYRELAAKHGVEKRCFWLNRFIVPEEIGDLFEASDLVLLTYSKDFRSASGVLNASIRFRKPCLASSGESNLRSVVSRYGLGVWIEPDRLDEMLYGLQRLSHATLQYRWEDYAREHSWERNADIVSSRMFNLPSWSNPSGQPLIQERP
jgi:glycosyltransferase involved in cell wall biosynthesis